MKKIFIRDIMTHNPLCVREDAPLEELEKIFLEKRIHAVPVVREKNILCGIIAESDFFSREGDPVYFPYLARFASSVVETHDIPSEKKDLLKKVRNITAKDILSFPVETVSLEDTILDAMKIFLEKGYGTLPVCDSQKKVLGVVTVFDVMHRFSYDSKKTA